MTTEMSADDFLAHYGVAGMKWGQRKATSSETRANNKANAAKDEVARLKSSGSAGRQELRGAKRQARELNVKAKIDKDTADAQDRIAKSGGSKALANTKVVGRTMAIGMLANVASNLAYSALSGSPAGQAAVGIGTASVHLINLTYGVKDVLGVAAQKSTR